MPAVPASSLQLHTPSTHVSWTRRDRVKRTCCQYGRASHTGNAIRATYSSVSVGVVHVLCACAQVQSTVWCSCLITQFSPCCKMYFYMRKGQKHCILRCFCFPSAAKNREKMLKKGPKSTSKSILPYNFSFFFPGPGPPKKRKAKATAHWYTHLLRTIFANSDVECNGRAKTPTINWHEEWNYI